MPWFHLFFWMIRLVALCALAHITRPAHRSSRDTTVENRR
jgi:hypothetical protein